MVVLTGEPLVSVCLPAYNAERWIASAVESVLAQTYERVELVVSDGASTDGTAEIVGSYGDPRIRLEVALERLPAVVNYNRSIQLSRGDCVKFLHADDVLEPSCIEEMVGLAREDPGIGLVFARRAVALEEPDNPSDIAWIEEHANPHARFGRLERVNEGMDLFRQMLDTGFEGNWVGEPSSVLMTRKCLVKIGLFSPRLRQVMDLELWLRAMLRYRIGFIDAIQSTYLHHGESITGENARLGHDWLDHLWLLEGLLREPLQEQDRAGLEKLRSSARRQALRTQGGRVLRRRFSPELGDYARYLAASRARRPFDLHPDLVEADAKERQARSRRRTKATAH
jgi:glycosyltransferase involved in cell wall biosynthesis